MVDPLEALPSSGHLEIAPNVGPPPRASLPSIDPGASVQWFERVFPDEAPSNSIDVEVQWDDDLDSAPTLVLRRPRLQ